MDKPIAAIEFGSKKIKVVIGYELEGQVYAVYAYTKPYGHIVEGGRITDSAQLIREVYNVKCFSDPSAKLKFNISEAMLAVPPFGLEVLDTTQVTTVVSEEGKVGPLDIKNIYSLIRNGAIDAEKELVDVIPERFITEQGNAFSRPPLGQFSRTLTVEAKVHTLPKMISKSYQIALTEGEINVRRTVVAPLAACELLATYDEVPDTYLLVDIGSNVTTVSLVGVNQLYASRFFEWGGDDITDKIVSSFNINVVEAEKLKIRHGIDKREMTFKAPICQTDDGEGNVIKHYVDELNTIIKSQLDLFARQLNAAIDEVLLGYNPSMKNIPMILIGGGSALTGLVEYLEPKVPSETVTVIKPHTLGARNPAFLNCLGMILVNSIYPSLTDEVRPRVGTLSRDPTDE